MNKNLLVLMLSLFIFCACKDETTFIGKDSKLDFSYIVNSTTKTVSFNNLSTDNFSAYYWDFGDGNISKEISPVHVYNLKGSYIVLLRAFNIYADGFQEISKEIDIDKIVDNELKIAIQDPLNIDYAGFDISWTKANIPKGAEIKLFLSKDSSFSTIEKEVIVNNQNTFSFKNLIPKQLYWYRAKVSYYQDNSAQEYYSNTYQVKLTDFYVLSNSFNIEEYSNDLDVMHFRLKSNTIFSNHVEDIINSDIPNYIKFSVSIDGTDTLAPIEGKENTYLKEPYTFFLVSLKAMYYNENDQVDKSLIIGNKFLVKRNDNTLWKGSYTKSSINTPFTQLELGSENGDKIVFSLVNYIDQVGQSYLLSPTITSSDITQNTASFFDSINKETYYLSTSNISIQLYKKDDMTNYFKMVLPNEQSTITFTSGVDNSKSILFKNILFAIN